MTVRIVGQIIFHSTVVIRSICFDVMPLTVGDAPNELANKD